MSPSPYTDNPYVEAKVWEILTPYFLPEHFPEKAALDRIFSKRRVLSSEKALRKSGFLIVNTSEKILVARHYQLKGYLIKTYLDDSAVLKETNTQEWYWWKKRIDGANIIQASINNFGYQDIMKVPKKWIYPLPADPAPKEGQNGRNFILVVEDMQAFDKFNARKAYRHAITPSLLDAIYAMLIDTQLYDGVYPHNVPFCSDGKLAFVDTEHVYHPYEVPLVVLAQYLSPDMHAYWDQLIHHP